MQIAKRKVYQHYKLSERLNQWGKQCDFDEVDSDDMEVESVSIEEQFMTNETVELAVSYLKGKDELTRKIFYLFYDMDKSIKEIAELLSVGESYVKNKLYRNINELRTYFVKEGMIPPKD